MPSSPRKSRSKPRGVSDAILRAFLDSVSGFGIYTLDAEGRVTAWDASAERLQGYSGSQMLGQDDSLLFTPEDRESGEPEKERRAATQNGRSERESWIVRQDGSRFRAATILTALRDAKGDLAGFLKITQYLTGTRDSQEELRRIQSELAAQIDRRQAAERRLENFEVSSRDISARLLRVQEEERRRIGRELHDSVGQYLAMLKMHLESLDLPPRRSARQLAGEISECSRLADDSLREIRTVSHLLYPPTLEEMGLKVAVPWFVEGFARRSNIHTTLEIDPDFPRLETEVEFALFRVLQECLNNVHRHSGSPQAFVRLYIRQGHVTLEIKDAGCGIRTEIKKEPEGPTKSYGVGLRGMRERMRQLDGDLEVSSNSHGTEVRASVPVAAAVSASG